MTDTMVERATAAALKALACDGDQFVRDNGDGTVTLDGRFDLKAVAKATIEALREPTPEMTAVMKNYIGRVDVVSATYIGMIDAALKE